jgi:hypothetical protein
MNRVHAVPGRLRIPSEAFRRRSDAREAAATARMMRGVELADVNAFTGSLLIYHDPGTIAANELIAMLRAQRWITWSTRRLSSKRRFNLTTALTSWLLRALLLGVAA